MGNVKQSVEIAHAVADLLREGTPFVCVTLITAHGSVSQEVGAELLQMRGS